MSSVPAATPPEPTKPSALWKWVKRIGCMLLLLACSCCGLFCTGAWWLDRGVRNMNKEEVDRIHAEGMQAGDIEAMFRRADPRFRERFTLQDLEAFLKERPEILERDHLRGVDLTRRTIKGEVFVKVKSKPSWFSTVEWEIVFKIVDEVLVLVGISPGLDDVVPESFRHRPRTGRRHRWFD